jgi:lipopolysaccharide/colanic/teichoic acid biosynthesis glycosyltransferase
VILNVPEKRKRLNKALVNCRMKGIYVYDMPTFYEGLMQKLPINYIKENWFLYRDGFEKIGSRFYRRTKRVLDLAISFFLLILFLPLTLIIALAIKIISKGPVFYKQERLGKNFESFNLIKFKTMVGDAEKEGPKWAQHKDLRVTPVGKILRKTRLDEIPQLVNVFRGEMSLIGPKPEREYFVKKLIKKITYYSFRLAVVPGLTGWAQVHYRYGSSVEDALEKLRYDLYYIKNMSLFLDLRIHKLKEIMDALKKGKKK